MHIVASFKIIRESCEREQAVFDVNPGKKKWSQEKWFPEKSWGERRASWCVCGMLRCNQSTLREKI